MLITQAFVLIINALGMRHKQASSTDMFWPMMKRILPRDGTAEVGDQDVMALRAVRQL